MTFEMLVAMAFSIYGPPWCGEYSVGLCVHGTYEVHVFPGDYCC